MPKPNPMKPSESALMLSIFVLIASILVLIRVLI